MGAGLQKLKTLLDEKVRLYNQPSFIVRDPISIPHRFTKKQDIEISGLFAAVLAWGNRTTIINSCNKLMQWMDNSPHEFVKHHTAPDLKPFLLFAHRTFNATDLLYFLHLLQHHYRQHESLEYAFAPEKYREENVEGALNRFHQYFFSLEHPERTRKHIGAPFRKSACKRMNMYLRWMVRKDSNGVDFGLWDKIDMSQLICPLDLHVARVAARLNLITSDKTNWQTALELTGNLKRMNPRDPSVYDYALFGMGMAERY